jgi:hypothetical protein
MFEYEKSYLSFIFCTKECTCKEKFLNCLYQTKQKFVFNNIIALLIISEYYKNLIVHKIIFGKSKLFKVENFSINNLLGI